MPSKVAFPVPHRRILCVDQSTLARMVFLLACITKEKMLFVSIALAFCWRSAVNLLTGWLSVLEHRNYANQSGFILVSCISMCRSKYLSIVMQYLLVRS